MPHKAYATSHASQRDAIQILTADHREVGKIFERFEKIKDKDNAANKQSLVKRACDELTIHAQVEEEIFYPALRKALKNDDLIDEAVVEHISVKQLIADLESMEPGDDLYDAKFTVLGEYVKHHVKEEQNEIFPQAKKSKMDLEQLGREITERKEQMKSEMGLETEEEEEEKEEK
ncbi:MAG: hemerythrin domain-containing protein [Sulfuricaulis sp.]